MVDVKFHLHKDIDKVLADVKDEYTWMENEVKEMRERLQSWNKDEEIQKLKEKNDWIYAHCLCPNLSDKEVAAIRDFKKKHYETCCGNGMFKNKGNTWRYEITGTGIGHIIKVQCIECGQWLDVTDIDNW